MSAIKKIGASTFIQYFATAFDRRNGTNKLATIKSHNDLVDLVNLLASNSNKKTTNQFSVTNPGVGVEPTFTVVGGGGAYACQGLCPCAASDSDLCRELYCCGVASYYGLVWIKIGVSNTGSTGQSRVIIDPFFPDIF